MTLVKGLGTPQQLPQSKTFPQQSGSPPIGDSGFSTKNLTVLTIDLSTARTDATAERFVISGTVLAVTDSDTIATTKMEVRIGTTGDFVTVYKGFSIGGVPFTEITVKNAAIVGGSMQIAVLSDQPGDRVDL